MPLTDAKAFLDIVNNETELLLVVRLHQLMDGLISDIIEEKLIEKHHLELRRIPCAVRIELAQAMGLLPDGYRGAFIQFNALRNRFAHETQTTITQKDAQDLYNAMGDHMRTLFNTNEQAFATPDTCVREIGAIIVITLEGAVQRLRDMKLWEIAMIQETRAVLGEPKHDAISTQVDHRIRARFDALKQRGGV